MSALGPDLDSAARRLGRELSPDLGTEEGAVERRAATLAAARRRRSVPARVAVIAILAVGLMVVATPALIARLGAIVRPPAAPTVAAVPATAGPGSTIALTSTGFPEVFIDVPVVEVSHPQPPGDALQVPRCSRHDVTLETEFGRDVYSPGEAAVVTLVLGNASATACSALADRCTSTISVFDARGAVVYSSVGHRYLCQAPGEAGPAQALRRVLQPGQAMTMTFRWLEQSCPGPPGPGCALVAPGRYTVIGEWAGFPTAGSGPAILSPEYGLITLPRHVTIA